jgi:transposase
MTRIAFQKETVKQLQERMGKAVQTGEWRVVRRIAVLLAIACGEGLGQLLEKWQISRQTVYTWFAEFLEKGYESLMYRKPMGRRARLTQSQKQQLVEAVKSGPEAAGYACGCWNTAMIQEWIERHFKVRYSRFYVAELLHNLGLSYQKARFVSGHLDEESRKVWMETVWPDLLAQAKREGVPIYFEDEASFAQWGSLAYTWALKGCQPQVQTSGIRKGYKVFGVIEFFSGQFYYQDTQDRFNSLTYRVFLSALLKAVPGKFILIQDGATYHTSKDTCEFMQQFQDRLQVFQLPSYSPDYNPIEHLWKKVKIRATHNRFFPDFSKLVNAVEEAFAFLDTHVDEILALMGVYTHHPAALPSA